MKDIPLNNSHSFDSKKNDTLNNEYLKNVILKYFCYQEGRNYKEANILMGAIMTILQMNKDERMKIEEARN